MAGMALAKCAAIVCEHIANSGSPVLSAFRTESDEPADSGWQFFCGTGDENPDNAKLWSVEEVLEFEPSLTPFIDEPPNVQIWRENVESAWRTHRMP
jgi:hypothetical protein